MLFHDDRVALEPSKYKAAMHEEWGVLACTHPYLWARLSQDVLQGQVTPQFLFTKTMSGANTLSAYAQRNGSSAYEHLPWTLGQGDVNKNLDDLLAGEEPDEPVSGRILSGTETSNSQRSCQN